MVFWHRARHAIIIALQLVAVFVVSCSRQETLPLTSYYEYDHNLPLALRMETVGKRLMHLEYTSVHQKRVPALLHLPEGKAPYPAVIFLHGIGDHKDADYMQVGDSMFVAAGMAVLRLDIDLHGERALPEMPLKQAEAYPYLMRDVLAQTVFDLRRAVDLLDQREDIDAARTAFLGISLGGIIGTVFCGVEPRVEYPMIALAGGGLRFALFGAKAVLAKYRDLLAPVEPLNFVGRIAPRPVLFLNASRDQIIPGPAARMLHSRARGPKKVIWYDAPHHMPPWPAFRDCIRWLQRQFAN